MLIRVKDNFYVSYNKNITNNWEMDGMMYRFFKFKFGGNERQSLTKL